MIRSFVLSFHRDENGVMSIISVFAVLVLVMILGMVMNVGRQADGKIRMQNAADAAVYSGGVVMARGMNTLAFTNHLLCDVFATTAFLREARDRNSESYVPSILAAWEREAPVFSGSGFEKFESLGPAISQKVPLEQELVRSYSVWAYAVSEAVLPLMEAILSEELIPQYQRSVVEATPDMAQAAAMEIAVRSGRPDHGRGIMLGALWRGSGALVGGDHELIDPSLPVVDPQLGAMPDQSDYLSTARRQRDTLSNRYLNAWNNQTMAFFDSHGKMSQFSALWRSFTCGYLRQLLDEEYPERNLPFVIRVESGDLPTADARNLHLDQYFTFVGVVYWNRAPEFSPVVFENPIAGHATAFAQARVFIPRRRLVWAYIGGGGGGSSSINIGGVPTDLQSLGGNEPGQPGQAGSAGYWEVVRQPVPSGWNLLNQRWSCQLVPTTVSSLTTILQTIPPLPEFAAESVVLPSLGDVSSEEIGRINTH